MSKLISCQFNIDTACVELVLMMEARFPLTAPPLKTKLPITASSGQADYLIYNDPLAYADLVLNGDPEAYLNAVTDYDPPR